MPGNLGGARVDQLQQRNADYADDLHGLRGLLHAIAPVPEDDLSGRWPSGGYLASTDDLAQFGRAFLASGLLNAQSLETMLTPQHTKAGVVTAVGIGWRVVRDAEGRVYYHHGGSSNGGSAFLLIYPHEQLVIALASNALGTFSEKEALALAHTLLQ